MRFYKPLMFLGAAGIALTAFGAGYDIGGPDGQGDHTPPYIIRAATSDISHTVANYIANSITGDTMRMVPRYHRPDMEVDQTVSATTFINFTVHR